MKSVPQADAKSASMGWFFDPGFIQNVQRVAADVEDPSMESIDSVLFALREMGYIRTAETCEHGFSVDECVEGMCELQTENAILRARVARLEEVARGLRDGLKLIRSGDHEDRPHSVAGYALNIWKKELDALEEK